MLFLAEKLEPGQLGPLLSYDHTRYLFILRYLLAGLLQQVSQSVRVFLIKQCLHLPTSEPFQKGVSCCLSTAVATDHLSRSRCNKCNQSRHGPWMIMAENAPDLARAGTASNENRISSSARRDRQLARTSICNLWGVAH